ncbi:MAG: hypothetical protein AAF624_09285 [Bacteroidota bacterium]
MPWGFSRATARCLLAVGLLVGVRAQDDPPPPPLAAEPDSVSADSAQMSA